MFHSGENVLHERDGEFLFSKFPVHFSVFFAVLLCRAVLSFWYIHHIKRRKKVPYLGFAFIFIVFAVLLCRAGLYLSYIPHFKRKK